MPSPANKPIRCRLKWLPVSALHTITDESSTMHCSISNVRQNFLRTTGQLTSAWAAFIQRSGDFSQAVEHIRKAMTLVGEAAIVPGGTGAKSLPWRLAIFCGSQTLGGLLLNERQGGYRRELRGDRVCLCGARRPRPRVRVVESIARSLLHPLAVHQGRSEGRPPSERPQVRRPGSAAGPETVATLRSPGF